MQNGTFVFCTHISDPFVYGVILDLCFLTTAVSVKTKGRKSNSPDSDMILKTQP